MPADVEFEQAEQDAGADAAGQKRQVGLRQVAFDEPDQCVPARSTSSGAPTMRRMSPRSTTVHGSRGISSVPRCSDSR